MSARAGDIEAAVAPLLDDPEGTAIFTDLDGTLAPIVGRPDEAAVPAQSRELLAAVAERFGWTGVVSGRRAVDARRIVGLDGVIYVGNHGFELLEPGAGDAVPSPAVAEHGGDAPAFAEHHLGAERLEAAGLRFEDKAAIVALHWRGARDERLAEAEAREIANEAVVAGLLPHWGRKVLEVRPPVALDKGTALGELLESCGARRAMYAGDDRTDADAFAAIGTMLRTGDLDAGLRVGVVSAESPPEVAAEADLIVDGTEGFVEVLRTLR